MKMTVMQIADAAGAKVLAAPCSDNELITGVTWDSRDVENGCLYVALEGERVDGHEFVASAVAEGARAALVSRDPGEAAVRAANDAGAAVLLVDDCQRALSDIAGAWRSQIDGRVVGITGSTGKTTTKNLVRDVLEASGSVVATLANQNNEIGVPNTLLTADADTDSVVVEMGMRGLGQIAELCEIARPDWGLVTNAGESHIELLGSRENIARAKSELFAALPQGGIAFVNAADDNAVNMCRFGKLVERGVRAVFFEGGDEHAHVDELGIYDNGNPFVWASDIVIDAEGRPAFTMHAVQFESIGLAGADGACSCSLELRGMHNVSNACSAAAVGLAAGLSLERCCEVLSAAQPEKGRQQIVRARCGALIVNDSYNANPDSMRASLSTFAALQVKGRRIAVLGDMLELGDFARECHERVGSYAVAAGLDYLICVGELSTSIADQAEKSGMDPMAISLKASADGALSELLEMLGPDDAVLVKASHSIGLQAVVEGLVD